MGAIRCAAGHRARTEADDRRPALELVEVAQLVRPRAKSESCGGVAFAPAPVAFVGDAFSEKLLSHDYLEVADCCAMWMRLVGETTDTAVVNFFKQGAVDYPTPSVLLAALASTTDRRDVLTYMVAPLSGVTYWIRAQWSVWMRAWDIAAGEVSDLPRSGSDRVLATCTC